MDAYIKGRSHLYYVVTAHLLDEPSIHRESYQIDEPTENGSDLQGISMHFVEQELVQLREKI
jgi:hypothetical protein